MTDHVHEWELSLIPIEGQFFFVAKCAVDDCEETLSEHQIQAMLNAAEQLDPLKARLYSEHILEDPPFLLDECAGALRAYAKARSE